MAAIVNVPGLDRVPAPLTTAVGLATAPFDIERTTAWRQGLPSLEGERLTLRDIHASDATSLLTQLTPAEVSRFLSPPPATVEGFERFITWAAAKREEGTYACFAIVPKGLHEAVGFFQLRSVEEGFRTAEWGFALGRAFWGTGLFPEGAELTLDFAFGTVGVQRLEARSVVANGRGNGALRKIGAVREAILRGSFTKEGKMYDQTLWSILDVDWAHARSRRSVPVVHERWH